MTRPDYDETSPDEDDETPEPPQGNTGANLRPKDVYTQQLIDEEYESYGEGARRDLFED